MQTERDIAIDWHEYERANRLAQEERDLRSQIEQLRGEWRQEARSTATPIGPTTWRRSSPAGPGVPVASVSQAEAERLLHAEEVLSQQIVGQNDAVHAISPLAAAWRGAPERSQSAHRLVPLGRSTGRGQDRVGEGVGAISVRFGGIRSSAWICPSSRSTTRLRG